MAKTTKRQVGAKRGAKRGGTSRRAAARKGGQATLRSRGPEFYSQIGRKGAKSRRAKSGAGRKTSRAGRARKSGARSSRAARGAKR